MPTSESFAQAEEAIRRRLAADAPLHDGELTYDPKHVVETDGWWYIPAGWIGCMGFIVNKSDLYVNWLGSGLFNIDEVFWGHDHGIYCDIMDFTFAANTDSQLTEKIVRRFKRSARGDDGEPTDDFCFYQDHQISDAVQKQFPTFKNHFVWYGIPEIFKAYQSEGLRFTCALTNSENR